MRENTSKTARVAGQVALGAVLAFAGVSHLTFARDEFQAQVPPWVLLEADVVVLASASSRSRSVTLCWSLGVSLDAASWARTAAAFFVAVFPGNIAQFVEHRDAFGLDSDAKRFVRLLFQPALVAWALVVTDVWRVLMDRRRRSGRR